MAEATFRGATAGVNDGGTSVIVTPGSSVADGDWLIIELMTSSSSSTIVSVPSGWVALGDSGAVNTRRAFAFGKRRSSADGASYTFTLNAATITTWSIAFGPGGVLSPSDWKRRTYIAANETVNRDYDIRYTYYSELIANGMNTTDASRWTRVRGNIEAVAGSLIFTWVGEATSATETESQIIATGATKVLWAGHNGSAINTHWLGVDKVTSTQMTAEVLINYPNVQNSNGMGHQIIIPPLVDAPTQTRIVAYDGESATMPFSNQVLPDSFERTTVNPINGSGSFRRVLGTGAGSGSTGGSKVPTGPLATAKLQLQKAATDPEGFGLFVLADSMLEGTGQSTIEKRIQHLLAARLGTQMEAASGSPYVPAFYNFAYNNPTQPPMNAGPVWTGSKTMTSIPGLGRRAYAMGINATVTLTRVVSSMDVSMVMSTNDQITIKWGTAAAITYGPGLVGHKVFKDPAGIASTPRSRTAVVSRIAGGPVNRGFMAYTNNETSGIRIIDGAKHGTMAYQFTSLRGPNGDGWHPSLDEQKYHMGLLGHSTNDAKNGETAEMWEAATYRNMAVLRKRANSGNLPILIFFPWEPYKLGAGIWATYRAAAERIRAADQFVEFADFSTVITSQQQKIDQDLLAYQDGIHWNDKGAAMAMEFIFNVLTENGTLTKYVAASGGTGNGRPLPTSHAQAITGTPGYTASPEGYIYEGWVRLDSDTDIALGGLTIGATGEGTGGIQALIDARNGADNASSFQLKYAMGVQPVAKASPSAFPISKGQKYRIRILWKASDPVVTAQFYNASGTLMQTLSTTTEYPAGRLGIYSFGSVTFDDLTFDKLATSAAITDELELFMVDSAGVTQNGYLRLFDGTQILKAERFIAMPSGTKVSQLFKNNKKVMMAHRGGSLDYSEHSARGFTQCVMLGVDVLEFSVARTSDGVWFGLHDDTLNRTTPELAANYKPAEHTWAEISQLTQVVPSGGDSNFPRQPYMKLGDLSVYFGSHTIFIDPKVIGSANIPALFTYLKTFPNWADTFVIKYFHSATWLADMARTAGFKSWGYYYVTDMDGTNSPQIGTTAGSWDYLGLEYSASQTYWDQIKAYGKPVIAHIVPTATAAASAFAKGADGLQISGVRAVMAVY